MGTWSRIAWQVLSYSNHLIIWNLFLAFIPLVISLWLFRWSKERSLLWWLGFFVFVSFLPNAPYVLTDVIHLIQLIQAGFSVWIITLLLIPQYTLFLLAGFEAYVISLINFGHYLKKQGLGKYILSMEIIIHILSAIGIYLGRFLRFNSWDFITRPNSIVRSTFDIFSSKYPIIVITLTTLVLVFLYWFVKEVNLGIYLRMKLKKLGKI